MSKRTCSVDGCDRPYHAHGLCGMHWQRQRRLDPAEKARDAAWAKSPPGLASLARGRAKYRASPEGQQAEAAYRTSAERKAALMKYTAGEKFKAQQARYRATPKGKATNYRAVARYHATHKDRIAAQRDTPESREAQIRGRRARAATPVGRAKKSAKEALRRALKCGVESERVTVLALIERDQGRCGLCGQAVLLETKYPDPLSPSMDHILPLSLGGPHVADNLQLAHLICNIRKGNRAVA